MTFVVCVSIHFVAYLENLGYVSQVEQVVHLAGGRQQLSYDVVEHVYRRYQHGLAWI